MFCFLVSNSILILLLECLSVVFCLFKFPFRFIILFYFSVFLLKFLFSFIVLISFLFSCLDFHSYFIVYISFLVSCFLHSDFLLYLFLVVLILFMGWSVLCDCGISWSYSLASAYDFW